MSKTHLIISDQHAHPGYHNKRADWLASLIVDLKPDVVVNIGDAADMASLNGFDVGRKDFVGKNYERDIESHVEFQDRVWSKLKRRKRKLPRRVFLEGNHEHRIKKAINLQPHLEGDHYGISTRDLQVDKYYDEFVEYNGDTPGIIEIDGITYAHYLVSGLLGRPIGGEHHASSLLSKHHGSCTVGHSHAVDYSVRKKISGPPIMATVCGVYQDYHADWAGESNNFWWRGLVVKHGVNNGVYDPEFVSINRLKKAYG